MEILIVLGYIVLVIMLLTGVFASLLGLPGSVLVFLAALGHSAATHWQRPTPGLLIVFGLLMIGAETLDNLLSIAAARARSQTPRAGWIALWGGVAGGALGAWVGPLIGALGLWSGPLGFLLGVIVTPLVGAALGGYGAVYWYELRGGKTPVEARAAAKASLTGRLLGLLGKALLTALMAGTLIWIIWAAR